MHRKVDKDLIRELAAVVGEKNLITQADKMRDYSHDEFSLKEFSCLPEIVVKPCSAEDVSNVMRIAGKRSVAVTPRGGATGLCGGCVPASGGIVLSLERMDRVIEIDLENQMAVVEAGVTLSEFYKQVERKGLFFPPHPGEESAMLGGVIATNAGGARAVKYGVIRNYVRGLDVVLPSGDVIQTGGKLMKCSTGYNLLNLFIGSEGTLGIITRAIIQLMPSPMMTRSLIVPYNALDKAIHSVPVLLKNKILPLAVEFIPQDVIKITEDFLKQKWPVKTGSTFLLIILDAPNESEMDRLSEEVADLCLSNDALDVFVADNPKKQEQVLSIRSKIYEAIKSHTVEILDVVVPRAEIARHVQKVQELSEEIDMWLPTFGHAADGNVHTHIMSARYRDGVMIPVEEEQWKEKVPLVREALYQDCRKRQGMISGEHGIGIVKKPYLSYVLSDKEISLMKGIKKIFDPDNLLNPGKIFD